MHQKPILPFWQVWNMCFGFMGIQFGFALQNANVSRIFQSLGASIDELPILWLAGPVTGLLVQPIVGYLSDRTWNRLGRRRPFFLAGAILSTIALVAMPNSPYLWMAAGLLWVLDASINIAMEPMRALVGDSLPARQRAFGYSLQSWFIGIGAIVASALPWILTNALSVDNTATAGSIPDSVKWSFYLGAIVFIGAVSWTVLRTPEYSPEELDRFAPETGLEISTEPVTAVRPTERFLRDSAVWLAVGAGLLVLIITQAWRKELLVLATGLIAFGALQFIVAQLQRQGRSTGMLVEMMNDVFAMPRVMRQLAIVQCFTWFGLFAMWIYATPAVAAYHFGSSDPTSPGYNEGANWVGILFTTYNGIAAVAALLLPWLAHRIGVQRTHWLCLVVGGAGLASFVLIDEPRWLLLPMVGLGFAWASILSMPYAMLAGSLPARKMGIYMGIFNLFIVMPQIVAASLLGVILKSAFGGETIYVLALAGALLFLAGFLTLRVRDPAVAG